MKGAGWRMAAVLVLTAALLSGLASTAGARPSGEQRAAATIRVGIVYSRTGPLAAYGAQYISGLRWGLNYATKGTNKVGNNTIELTLVDDAGDPAKAVTAAKDLIGKGYKILGGSISSGVAVQMAPLAAQNNILFISGPAKADAVTGANKNTFRSGVQTYQDVKAAASYLGYGVGKKVAVFAQDTVFGQGNYLAVKSVMGDLGGQNVDRVLVPFTATDFTPFVQQLRQKNPDLLFVAWAGTTTPTMFQALDQGGIFSTVDKVVLGLAERSTYTLYGAPASKLSLVSSYLYNAPKNKVNDWLVTQMKRRGQIPDLFTPDGFVAGQMIVRALQASTGDVSKMISALEGWSFVGPKGQVTIRASDHAMIQPYFLAKLVRQGGKWVGVPTKTLKAKYVAPPEKK